MWDLDEFIEFDVHPDYRLQVDDYRAFYTVDEQALRVEVLRVMHKDETYSYYEELTK